MNLNLSIANLARSGLLDSSNYFVTKHRSQNSFINCQFSRFSSTIFNFRRLSTIHVEKSIFSQGRGVLISGFDHNAVNDNALNYQEYKNSVNMTASALFKGCKFLEIQADIAPLILDNHSYSIEQCIFYRTYGKQAGAFCCDGSSLQIALTNFTGCTSAKAGIAYFKNMAETADIVGVTIEDCFCKDAETGDTSQSSSDSNDASEEASSDSSGESGGGGGGTKQIEIKADGDASSSNRAHIFVSENSDYRLGAFFIEYATNEVLTSVPFFYTNDVDYVGFEIGEVLLPFEGITIFKFQNALIGYIHQIAFIDIGLNNTKFIEMSGSQVLVKSICSSTGNSSMTLSDFIKKSDDSLFLVNDSTAKFGLAECNYELAKADIQNPTAKLEGLDLTLSIVTCVIFFVFFIAVFSVLIALVFCHIGNKQDEEEEEPEDGDDDISFDSFSH